MNSSNDYWRIYHDADSLKRADALRRSIELPSTGVRLNVDIYARPEADAPVFIFNHGGGGYSRLFIPQALALHDRGYTVVLPDQRGQGLSEGDRGDFTIDQLVQNVVDVIQWARRTCAGPIFVCGASAGSGLAYSASAQAPVNALILHNLYQFASPADSLVVSRLAPLVNVPGIPALMGAFTRLGAMLMPRLRVPFRLLGIFERMVDERAVDFFDQWKQDPLPIKAVTLRYMASTMTTPPAIPFSVNRTPALVINPIRDRMVDPEITRRNAEKLGGPKQMVDIDYGHWAMGPEFVALWVAHVDRFLSPLWRQSASEQVAQAQNTVLEQNGATAL